MLINLKDLLNINKIHYGDIRYEKNNEVSISYEGRELKEVKDSYREGGHLRIYNQGSKAVASFSQIEDAAQTRDNLLSITSKVKNLKKEQLKLKFAIPAKEKITINPETDPRNYSLKDKIELLQNYNQLALKQKHVINTMMHYREFYSKRIFINSEETEIEYELLGSYISGTIFAKKNGLVQSKRIAFGAYPEFSNLYGRNDELLQAVEHLQEMLDAEPIKAGTYPIILNPKLAAVFIHEAFGHYSEADLINNNPAFLEKLQTGRKMGNDILNVIDDPTIANIPGHYKYDDEGIPGQRTELIKNGILSGRLHSRKTASDFKEPLSGNMRAVDCYHTPIIRMSNIFIDNGRSKKEDLFSSIDNGYYLLNGKGGQTTGDQFTFGAEYGYRIKNGKIKEMIRDINISGELFSTLKNISLIANDLSFGEAGGCGKGSPMQLNIFSGMGAPHIKIDQANIGGK